jgi:hypothetical protein
VGSNINVGSLRIFVEDRTLDEDGGPSLQVWATVGAREVQLLRFDMFRQAPHYHFAPDGRDQRVDLDPEEVGDGVAWTIDLLRREFPQLVAKAGYVDALAAIDTKALVEALPNIETLWRAQSEPVATRL